jgi:Protein of unknown function, DUF481
MQNAKCKTQDANANRRKRSRNASSAFCILHFEFPSALAWSLAILISSSPTAWAQKRTDVVTLLNGDRFTGEITDLNRGRLELKTDDAGTIEIEWDKIARIEAARQFEVETSDGRRLLGSLGMTGDGAILIVGSDGDVSLPMPEVTRITAIGASFWAKLEGAIDAGFTYTHSSGIAQTTLNSDTVYRRPAFLFRLTSSATLTQRSDEAERDDRAAVDFSYVRYRGRRLFVAGNTGFETNESLGLLLRSQLGMLVGLRLVNTNRAQFELGSGLVVNDERGVDAEPTQNVEGAFSLRTSYYTYDRPKTQFDGSVQYYPSLSNWGRQRLQVDSSVRRELLKDFFAALNVFYTFDSAPPNPDADRTDVGVVVSIGWSY